MKPGVTKKKEKKNGQEIHDEVNSRRSSDFSLDRVSIETSVVLKKDFKVVLLTLSEKNVLGNAIMGVDTLMMITKTLIEVLF